MKLLVVDAFYPERSFFFYDLSSIGAWMWGRSINQYHLFLVSEDGTYLKKIKHPTRDVKEIQEYVTKEFKKAEKKEKEEKYDKSLIHPLMASE